MNLIPGTEARFSVRLKNLSPWGPKTSVKYLLRVTSGGSTFWDAGKPYRDISVCPEGDAGFLNIEPVGVVNLNLRDGVGDLRGKS